MEIKLNKELQQILEMVISGMSNRQIAVKLNYSRRNVEYKLTKLFKLYKVENRLQLSQEYLKQLMYDL